MKPKSIIPKAVSLNKQTSIEEAKVDTIIFDEELKAHINNKSIHMDKDTRDAIT